MTTKRIYVLFAVLVVCICAIAFRTQFRRPVAAAVQMIKGKKTIADRVGQFGETVQARLEPEFQAAGLPYPPAEISLIGLKDERILELWAAGSDGKWKYIRSYPVLGMSGGPGPKLKEGDRQVPEGIYQVESLNPNSLYHLALRINYPNQYDIMKGKEDGRTDLGSDIMIHGKDCSIGCLAMGDEAAEDLFIIAEKTGIQNINVILAPEDFRIKPLPADLPPPKWTSELYMRIKKELDTRRKPAGSK